MRTKKRRIVLHRVAKTEIKNYTTPEKTIIRDVVINWPAKTTNWFTEPISYPRWAILLIATLIITLGWLS